MNISIILAGFIKVKSIAQITDNPYNTMEMIQLIFINIESISNPPAISTVIPYINSLTLFHIPRYPLIETIILEYPQKMENIPNIIGITFTYFLILLFLFT